MGMDVWGVFWAAGGGWRGDDGVKKVGFINIFSSI